MIERPLTGLYSMGALTTAAIVAWWMRRTGRWSSESIAQRYGRGLPAPIDQRPIWIHAASMGEVRVGATLAYQLSRHGERILASAMTETGYHRIADIYPPDKVVIRAPFDIRSAITRVCNHFRPVALIIIETEWWPNLISLAATAGISVFIVNGRVSDKSFPWYRGTRWYWRRVLAQIEHFYMRSETDAGRVCLIGIDRERITVPGSLKTESVLTVSRATRERVNALAMSARRIWIAGSTRPGEEEIILDAYMSLRAAHPGLQLWLVPRHPDRFDEVANLVGQRDISVRRWSDLSDSNQASCADVLLVDQMGILPELYGLADTAFVGGSLKPFGGHNPLEPALMGTPVMFGPHMETQRDSAELLLHEGLAETVHNEQDIVAAVSRRLSDRSSIASRESRIDQLRRLIPDPSQAVAEDIVRRLSVRRGRR